ncbi:MAG: polymer-forming cytoskeletal protein [Desulfobacteraceae bacterium]|jgi:cytoskeletal protein CcmA (bactofilin family)
MKDQTINAFLGKDTEFEGKLNFNGTVRIDGHFKGEIKSAEGNLIVGEFGMIDADIHISHIFISGEIRGNIIADHRIDLHPSGKVFGNIQTPTLSLQEGAILEGDVRMSRKEETYENRVTAIGKERRS